MLYAIATIEGTNGYRAIRFLDTESRNTTDIEEREVPFRLKQINVMNIEASNKHRELFRWSQGVEDRYPSIQINRTWGYQEVKNRDAVIALAYSMRNGKKVYYIANYEGKMLDLEEENLIQYGLKYSLANCKVVTKGNTKYIAAIEGSIPEKDIAAEGIKKLVLPINVVEIRADTFSNLPNLEEIEFKAGCVKIRHDAFDKCKKLRKIKGNLVVNSNRIGNCIIHDLPLLETIEFTGGLNNYSLLNCPKADINKALECSYKEVHAGAFKGNRSTKHLILPEHIKNLSTTSFSDCNIETVEIKSRILNIHTGGEKLFDYNHDVEVKYFKDSVAVIDGDLDKPNKRALKVLFKDLLNYNIMGDRVKLVEVSNEKFNGADRRVAKAAMLGRKISGIEDNFRYEEIATILEMSTEEEVDQAVVEMIKHVDRWNTASMPPHWTGKIGGIPVRIMLRYLPTKCPNGYTVKRDNNFYIITSDKEIGFVPHSKRLMLNYINNTLSKMGEDDKILRALDLPTVIISERAGLADKGIGYRTLDSGEIQVYKTEGGKEELLKAFYDYVCEG